MSINASLEIMKNKKRFLFLVATCIFFNFANASAQKVEYIVFAGTGFTTEHSDNIDMMKEQGYSYKAKPIAAAGIEIRIPIHNFYVKPSLSFDYIHNTFEKSSRKTTNMTASYYDRNGKLIKYETVRSSSSGRTITNRTLAAFIPVAFGYGFDIGEKPMHIDLGAMLYAGYPFINNQLTDSYSNIAYRPFHSNYGKNEKGSSYEHNKCNTDLNKNQKFKDLFSYGVGCQTMAGYKRFSLEYSLMFDLTTHLDADNSTEGNWFCHLFTVGFAF